MYKFYHGTNESEKIALEVRLNALLVKQNQYIVMFAKWHTHAFSNTLINISTYKVFHGKYFYLPSIFDKYTCTRFLSKPISPCRLTPPPLHCTAAY